MSRSFSLGGIIAGTLVLAPWLAFPAHAVEQPGGLLCVSVKEEAEVARLAKFFDLNLREHAKYVFSFPLKTEAQARAKDILVQRVLDRRTQLCAESLKAAEEIRAALKGVPADSSCASLAKAHAAAVRVDLTVTSYLKRLATAFEENRAAIDGRRAEHVKAIKGLLYNIAMGSNTGLGGVSYKGRSIAGAPKALRYEWLKKVAADLGGEAHVVWGSVDPDKNPLVQRNMEFARVATQVKREAETTKKRKEEAASRLKAGGCPLPASAAP